ncbi:MAG: transglutaminase-like domain-containing protein [Limisphaerales bacterium]
MKFPRYLLGLALLFWGYQTHTLVAAIPIALALEFSQFLRARWEFSDTDLNRIWDLCAVLLVAMGIIVATTNDAARASFQFVEYLPFVFVPIVAAQRFGTQESLKWSVFSWFLRRQPNTAMARRRADMNWIYFATCLFASSATHDQNPIFYPGMCLLVCYAMFSIRPGRMRLVPWLSLIAIITVMGFFTHHGLFTLQGKVQNIFDEFIADFLKRESDHRESHTSIGKTGHIKLSGQIVMRVRPEGSPLPPALLRESTYDTYAKGVWRGTDSEFGQVFVGGDEAAELLPKKPIRYSVRIARNLSSRFAALVLPHGAFALHDVGTLDIKTNRLGYARCESLASFVNYRVDYGPGTTFDAPPTAVDTNVPPSEEAVFEKYANELNVGHMPAVEKMQAVVDYFRQNFKYSTELRAQSSSKHSALESFMTTIRAGHCEYFATSATLLLRKLGVPTRYVTGYSVQPSSTSGDTFLVRARHAHAWAVAYDSDRKVWLEVDATPPDWNDTVSADASFWEPLSDFFSNLYFQYSKWRWSQVSYTKYLPGLLVPLIGILVWRIVRHKTSKRSVAADTVTEHHDWPGLDSEFFVLEKKLHEAGLGRLESEPLLHWRERLLQQLPETVRLDRTLNLHRRLRFDPNGLNAQERGDLRNEVSKLLTAFEAICQARQDTEDKKIANGFHR